MNKEELKKLLPHREPMLLLDEAELVGDEAHGKITITGDEYFLQGHFPGNPVVPGVIQCEMLAQNCCVLLMGDEEARGATPFYTSSIRCALSARCARATRLIWCAPSRVRAGRSALRRVLRASTVRFAAAPICLLHSCTKVKEGFMFDKVLIANRGEVAVRVIRACRDMGIKTVAVYSTADADALHVQLADEAYCIGGPRLAESYLNDDAVLTCAVKSGAKAIHPGYGFFSEKASFVRDCDKYGLAFVGPSAKVIDSMGDKDAARRTAAAAGVPIVPGCDLLKSPEEATAEAERIGCPVLIKARAGGGGRGIRKVERVEDAAKAFIEARAEGEAVFGDGECYMEKFVSPAHHVEVQIMADKQGHVFSLGERECSVQRRNQKLIEESPAPCLDGHDDIRARMHKAARDLARAVGYEGAGTIEFLYSDDGNFYFMEMNTRLQVEHPVTEFVTDTDLVKWQLRVAAGQPLPFEREDMPVRNHAMECRINAETPDFLPSCGTVTALRVPGGPRVRWDSAMFTGAKVPPYYDSMLGKLIVCAPTRDGAIRKMRSALGELVIEGVSENSELQLDVLANDEFLSGMYHTDLMGHLYADE